MLYAEERRSTVCLIFLLSCGFAMGWVAPAFGLPTLEEIRRVQARRVEKAGPLRFVWEGREVWVNGWDGRPDEPVPCRHGGEVIVSGSSIRFEHDKEVWSDRIGGVGEPTRMIVVWGDKAKKSYIPKKKNLNVLGDQPKGSVSWGDPETVSMTASYRADAPHLTPGWAMEVLREEETPEGRRVVVGNTDFNRPEWIGQTRTEYHLDPARDFVLVRRLLMYPDGRIGHETNVEYAPHAVLGYAPTRVTGIHNERGKVVMTNDIKVKQVEVNFAADPSMFDIKIPAGTVVVDQNSRTRYIEKAQTPNAEDGATSTTLTRSESH